VWRTTIRRTGLIDGRGLSLPPSSASPGSVSDCCVEEEEEEEEVVVVGSLFVVVHMGRDRLAAVGFGLGRAAFRCVAGGRQQAGKVCNGRGLLMFDSGPTHLPLLSVYLSVVMRGSGRRSGGQWREERGRRESASRRGGRHRSRLGILQAAVEAEAEAAGARGGDSDGEAADCVYCIPFAQGIKHGKFGRSRSSLPFLLLFSRAPAFPSRPRPKPKRVRIPASPHADRCPSKEPEPQRTTRLQRLARYAESALTTRRSSPEKNCPDKSTQCQELHVL